METQHPLTCKVLIFYADGTLRRSKSSPERAPQGSDDWELLPKVAEVLARYPRVMWGIVSTQSGVAFGWRTLETALRLLDDCAVELEQRAGMPEPVVMCCPHDPAAECPCRIPKPQMLTRVFCRFEEHFFAHGQLLEPGDCLYIGHREVDRQAARRARIGFMHARDFFGWER